MNILEKKDLEVQKFDLLYSQDRIARRIKEMGQQISADYADKNPILIGVLKGCIIFMADLIRDISIPMEIEFITASSYNNGKIPDNEVIMSGGPDVVIKGRNLLIIEGVVDSGKTVRALLNNLNLLEPASIEIVTLLDKPKCRQAEVDIKYIVFYTGYDFVIGFGLDESHPR